MTERSKTTVYILILVALSGFLFSYRLGVRGLAEPDEGRYAEIAREMVETGDWVVPRLNYIVHMHKPPMAYWLIASSFTAFGVNELAARLPSALAGIVTVIATFYIGMKVAGRRAGFLAGIALITMPQFLGSARLAFPDMFLTCFATVAYAFFIKGYYAERKAVPYLLFWAFAGLGMLTKGPVVLVIVVAPVIIYVLVSREWRLLLQMRPLDGIALFLIISLPWYLFVVMRFPGLLKYFLSEQTAARLTSDFRPQPRYYLPGVLAALSFPWFWYLPAGVGKVFRAREEENASGNLRYILLLWPLVTLGFFLTLRSSIASYILPAYPPLAILAGMFFDEQFNCKRSSPAFKACSTLTVLVMVFFAVISFYYVANFGQLVKNTSYLSFQNTVLALGIVFSVIAVLAAVFMIAGRARYVFVSLALFFPVFFIIFLHQMPVIEEESHWRVKGKRLAEEIMKYRKKDESVVMIGQRYHDLPFYLKGEVIHLDIDVEARFTKAEVYERLVRDAAMEKGLINSSERTFFVAPRKRYNEISSKHDVYFVGRAQDHVAFCNQPVDPEAGKKE